MVYPDLTRALSPATISLVGLTPLLAVSVTLITGLSMGLVYLAVLSLTSVTVYCIRRFIPTDLGLICLLLVSAAWVSIIDVLMQACCYALRTRLDIYLYLLAMNTTLLFYLEAFPLRKNLRDCTAAGLSAALTGVALLAVIGLLRELAATGGILTDSRLFSHLEQLESLQPAYFFSGGAPIFQTSAGALIIFGVVLVIIAYSRARAAR